MSTWTLLVLIRSVHGSLTSYSIEGFSDRESAVKEAENIKVQKPTALYMDFIYIAQPGKGDQQ